MAITEKSKIKSSSIRSITDRLFKLSESRGKEAAGLAIRTKEIIYTYKQPISASRMIKSSEYKKITDEFFCKRPLAAIGHSRLVTDGLETSNDNNQPVIKNNVIGIHNGIITNVNDLFRQIKEIKRKYEVDTEIILDLVQLFDKNKNKNSLIKAVQDTFSRIEGSASIALLFNNNPYLVLATNTGSLYVFNEKDIMIFASERYILEQLLKKEIGPGEISHLLAGQGCLVNLNNLEINYFSLIAKGTPDFSGNIRTFPESTKTEEINIIKKDILQYNENLNLRRCGKCILPESFPGIEFDENGVCNICNNYQKIDILGERQLKQEVRKFRKARNNPDCLVALSGGRDSSYALHYVKNVLKMNPVAFSYDWGMITDLGRRNQARLCGKLGIEHILVSADIKKKRENIRKNVLAWLKKPNLGIVPLFMAGDKQYFYYAQKLKKQLNLDLLIMGENLLEKTHFKTGFSGVKLKSEKGLAYGLGPVNKIKMALYYLKEFIKNPSYLNRSLSDTLWAYACYYFIPHNYVNLYKYIDWEERMVEKTLIDNYNWEMAKDTGSTWRIGDGTVAFYNYIYYTLAGFSENDTFRSNQIREGLISRDEALELVKKENAPRHQSVKWYCDTINIDFEKTIKIINSAPKFYKKN